VCSAAGCFDFIDVELVPPIDADYDAEIAWDGVALSFRCGLRSDGWRIEEASSTGRVLDCGENGFRVMVSPEPPPTMVEVSVTPSGGDTTSTTAMPDYRPFFPNGPDCPGRCEQGTVVLMLNAS
jgi:hypothetical protein